MHRIVALPPAYRVALAAIVSSVLCGANVWAAQTTVLVVYATRPDARIAVLADNQLPRLLERKLGQRVNRYSEHLDAARLADDVRYQSAVTDFLRMKYADQRFDLIIAMHEMVLDFLGTTRDELFPGTPVVFFTDTFSRQRIPNSTGVIAETNLAASIALAAKLQPAVTRVYVVTGAHERDKVFERRARVQLRSFESRLQITYLSGLTTPELKGRLSRLPDHSIVYYLLVNRDGAGAYFHPLEYLQDIAPVANAPIYSWVDSTMGHGVIGGSLKSQERQTEVVAELALRVLRGERPDSIATMSPDLHVNQVDWRQLRRWGIAESRVPAGTLVMFKAPTAWERYKVYIFVALTLVVAETALITVLLVQRVRRRQAEQQVLESQAELRTSYGRIRTLVSRLLNAQDATRAHIARELHDDVSQQLALLATDLELLRTAPRTEAAGLAALASRRAQTIARDVHNLAYSLYPATLRVIGLVPALQALQREMERSVIVVNLAHESVPETLPEDVTLSVYRVVHEALQNAVKYSAAREVSVSLEGTPHRLQVTIADDGVGFDVGAALGKGLGLVSMSERIEALNGTFEIHSAPGAGTRLVISVPLSAEARVLAAG
jgi:signal transduction histidine kinase